MSNSVIPWTVACSSVLLHVRSLLKFMSIELVMAILPSHPLPPPLLLLPSVFPSIRIYPNELAFRIRRPKYWSLGFSNSPSNEYSGLISFRADCFNLLAVQGSLKSLLQQPCTVIEYNYIEYQLYCLLFNRQITV